VISSIFSKTATAHPNSMKTGSVMFKSLPLCKISILIL
jgi:hypothetical protein